MRKTAVWLIACILDWGTVIKAALQFFFRAEQRQQTTAVEIHTQGMAAVWVCQQAVSVSLTDLNRL